MSDIDERVMHFVIQSSRLTAQSIVQAWRETRRNNRYLRNEKRREKRQSINGPKAGRQALDDLMKQGRQTTFVAIDEKSDLKHLQKELNKYSVDFSIVKEGAHTWNVFFKAQDAELFNVGFKKVIENFDPEHKKQTPLEEPKEPPDVEKKKERVPELPTSVEKEQSVKSPNPPTLTLQERLDKAKKEAKEYNHSVRVTRLRRNWQLKKQRKGLEK